MKKLQNADVVKKERELHFRKQKYNFVKNAY